MGGVKTDGTLWTWGANESGELGINDRAHRSSPVQVPGTTWKAVYGGIGEAGQDSKRLAVKTDGTLWGWGWQNNGELGQNNRTTYSSPVQVPGTWSTTVKPTGTGYGRATFAVKPDGTLWSWGANESGGLGINDTIKRSSPVQVPGSAIWGDISATGIDYGASGIKVGLTPSQL